MFSLLVCPVQWETNFQQRISALGQKMMTVLSQQSPPSGSEGVDAAGDNATLEMQRYIGILAFLPAVTVATLCYRRVLAKLRSFNSSVEQDLNEQRTKLERYIPLAFFLLFCSCLSLPL